MRRIPAMMFLAVLMLPPVAGANSNDFASLSWNGSVVGVLDGDTLDILHNRHTERIRLHGIDCPEKGQAFGKVAKLATSTFAFGRTVTVKPRDMDKYKRTVAEVFLPDGASLTHELVKDGWSWYYWKYAPDDTVLNALETEARQVRKGLWIDPNPVSPWKYRKARRGQSLNLSDVGE